MNREQKAELVTSLKSEFAQSKASFLINFRGLTVNQVQKLRKGLRAKGSQLKVAKARLIKMAAHDMPAVQALLPYFKEQIGVIFVKDEATSIAKLLSDFAKDNEAFTIVAGSFEQRLLDQAAIVRIASLPSKEILMAQLCGTLKAPMAKLAITLQMLHAKRLEILQ